MFTNRFFQERCSNVIPTPGHVRPIRDLVSAPVNGNYDNADYLLSIINQGSSGTIDGTNPSFRGTWPPYPSLDSLLGPEQ